MPIMIVADYLIECKIMKRVMILQPSSLIQYRHPLPYQFIYIAQFDTSWLRQ